MCLNERPVFCLFLTLVWSPPIAEKNIWLFWGNFLHCVHWLITNFTCWARGVYFCLMWKQHWWEQWDWTKPIKTWAVKANSYFPCAYVCIHEEHDSQNSWGQRGLSADLVHPLPVTRLFQQCWHSSCKAGCCIASTSSHCLVKYHKQNSPLSFCGYRLLPSCFVMSIQYVERVCVSSVGMDPSTMNCP